MNARTQTASLAQPSITMLALGSIVPSGTHIQELRRARFDQRLLGELADSIRAVGVLQPILVRRSQANAREDRFELVVGERRWLAGKKAALAEIPATVRDLSDEQVLEVQLIENLQREGLHELEEAEGYEELMKLKRISADAVADMVGRSRSYVFKRTKLLALVPELRKAFYAAEFDASTALLLARIPHAELQKEAFKEYQERRQYGDISNFKDAQAFFHEHYMLQLKAAPFKLDDADLVPKAGPCTTCPKRTGNQKELFGDVKSGDVCTDTKCFAEKRAAGEVKLIAEYKEKGLELIVGEAARRILSYSDTNASGGYHTLNDTCWDDKKQRTYKQLVDEKDVKLVKSPHTGNVVKVVHASAVPAAKAERKRRLKAGKTRVAQEKNEASANARILAAVHEKFSGDLTKPFVQQLLVEVALALDSSGADCELLDEHMAKVWKITGQSVPSHSDGSLPKALQGFDAKKLAKLAIEILVLMDLSDGSQRRAGLILGALKIDRKAIAKQLEKEAKAAEKGAAKK